MEPAISENQSNLLQNLASGHGVGRQNSISTLLSALMTKHLLVYKNNWKVTIFFRIILPAFVMTLLTLEFTFRYYQNYYTPRLICILLILHYIYEPAKEQCSKFKLIQMMALKKQKYLYWSSSLLVDLFSILLLALWAASSFTIIHNGVLLASLYHLNFILFLATLLFGVSAALNAYVLSTLVKAKPKMNSLGTIIKFYIVGVLINFLMSLMILVSDKFQFLLNTFDTIFIIIYPTDAYTYIRYGLVGRCYIKFTRNNCYRTTELISPIIFGLLALCSQILLYSWILYLIEYKNFNLDRYLMIKSYIRRSRSIAKDQQQGIGPINQLNHDKDVSLESTKAVLTIKNVPEDQYSLVVANLSKSFEPKRKIVEYMSFTIGKSECFGLLGINDTGKSTLLSMLLGEIAPDSGEIWLNPSDRLGYSPQVELDCSLKVIELIRLVMRLKYQFDDPVAIDEQVIYSIDLLRLRDFAATRISKLSPGNQRKLNITVSLIGDPTFLILDEPTRGLDSNGELEVRYLLQVLGNRKTSILLSSQSLKDCEAVCDRIGFMNRGRLNCIGSPEEVKAKFSTDANLKAQLVRMKEDKLEIETVESI